MRNQALDVLRGVAILLVIVYHYSRIPFLFNFGWTGVDLFFVLSGFLISGLLFREYQRAGRIRVGRFWLRRGFKIYPSFYLMMGITAASLYAALGHEPPGIPHELLFVQNYGSHIWEHTWSLAVEEHFYFILPLGLLLLIKARPSGRDPFRPLPLLFACVACICLGLRLAGQARGMNWVALHAMTHFRIDSLFAGVFLGYLKHFRASLYENLRAKPLWLVAVPCLLPAVFMRDYSPFMNTWGFTALYIGYACVLLKMVEKPPSGSAFVRGVAYVGKHSYSIYLWHGVAWPVLFHGRFDARFLALGFLVSIPLGILLSKLVEMPALRIRDAWFPERSKRGPEARSMARFLQISNRSQQA